jgi:hypothetical protein
MDVDGGRLRLVALPSLFFVSVSFEDASGLCPPKLIACKTPSLFSFVMTGSHTSLPKEQLLFNVYTGLCGAVFIFAPHVAVKGSFPDLQNEGFDIACIYAQVVGFQFIQMMMVQCPGPRGLQMSMFAMVAGMMYHILAKGVTPPPPVMGGVAIVLATPFYTGMTNKDKHDSALSQNMFMIWNIVQGGVFYMTSKSTDGAPGLTDSFPDIANVPGALDACLVWCEVISALSFILVLLQCPGPLGRGMGMAVNLAIAYYHYSKGIMPPPPVVALSALCCLFSFYTYFTQKKTAKED